MPQEYKCPIYRVGGSDAGTAMTGSVARHLGACDGGKAFRDVSLGRHEAQTASWNLVVFCHFRHMLRLFNQSSEVGSADPGENGIENLPSGWMP